MKQYITCFPPKIEAAFTTERYPSCLKQVHGVGVVLLPSERGKEADACISRKSSVHCAVRTADCLPILVASCEGTEVAAIHAGWRGLVAGVIEETFSKMWSRPEACIAWVGPAICQKHFEVGSEVREAFLKRDADFESGFVLNEKGRYQADLAGMAEQVLRQLGVNQVIQSGLCTFEDERLYSYRRNPGEVNRMVSLIYIRS